MTTEDAIEALEALATDADDFGSTRYRMVDAEAIRAVLARLRDAENERNTAIDVSRTYIHHAEQVLGKALGFPWHKDDLATFPGATEDDGVCTGCHTIVSLARVAVDRIRELEMDKRERQGILDRIDNQVGETLERIGHSPGPPAGFPDRLDTLCRLVSEQADRLHELERERSDLMRVLEAILIEVEPLRYEQRQDIERACRDQAEWAKRANASRIPGSEPWAFMNEFRRRLESKLEPLSKAVQEGNAAYDRIAAGIDNTKGCSDA